MTGYEPPLTVAEAAEFMKVCQATVRRLVDKKELPVLRPTKRRLRFWKNDLIDYLNGTRS